MIALLVGTATYAVTGFLVQLLPLANWSFFLIALGTLTAAARLIPHHTAIRSVVPAHWWDLPARMLIATTIVLTLTGIATFVGAKTAGVLASFPVFGTILAIFAHRIRGAVMATQVLRGMVLALYGFATFFFILGLLLTTVGILPAFLAAIATTLLIQMGALRLQGRWIFKSV